jgi:hypothetical protein
MMMPRVQTVISWYTSRPSLVLRRAGPAPSLVLATTVLVESGTGIPRIVALGRKLLA